ncbi:MAG: SGNH/GDSL hydrolase family protein [Lachnospiraceae bacterium]|nr:SGNH/GDSL hydrolase family protein [Lachnospiraceae bacterium]
MRKSGFILLAVCLSLLMGLTGCQGTTGNGQTEPNETINVTDPGGQNGSRNETATQNDPAAQKDPNKERHSMNIKPSPTDYLSEEQMALADSYAASSEAALAAVMRKAERGEPVTIAAIGGSITMGTISQGSKDNEVSERKMYAEIFRDWWTETFPESEVTWINAGIGATDSYLGVHRVQVDVLDHDPDLVLVEFSVNDEDNIVSKTNYDNLVRRILKSESEPAVMLLFMAQTSLVSAQNQHQAVGFPYALPMLSYRNVIKDLMESGTYTAKDLSGDEVHPSALGHRIAGEMIWKYLNSVYEAADTYEEPETFSKKPVTKEKYLDSRILGSKELEITDKGTFEESRVFEAFPDDLSTGSGDGELTFTATFKNLGILYYRQTDGKGGQFEVFVDGEKAALLDADFTGGWGNYADAKEVFSSEEAGLHTVVIKKSPDSRGEEFSLLGVLVSE